MSDVFHTLSCLCKQSSYLTKIQNTTKTVDLILNLLDVNTISTPISMSVMASLNFNKFLSTLWEFTDLH